MSADAILTAASVDASGFQVYWKYPGSAASPAHISIGVVEANEDFALRVTKRMDEFTASQFGEGTIVDGIFTGQSCTISMVLQEINNTAALGLAHPEAIVGGVAIPGELGTPGALASSIGGSLQLAPYFTTTPTYADGSGYKVIEIPYCFTEDGAEVRRQLAAGRHSINLTLRVFAFIDGDDSDTPKLWRYVSAVS